MISSVARIQQDLNTLANFGGSMTEGVTRLPFTKEARECVDYLKQQMTEAGMTVWEDVVGNVYGKLEGSDPQAPAVMMGSHYDTVLKGGAFDGIAGVVSAIEVARLIRDSGVKLKNSFIAVGFNDEEGLRFNSSYLGSEAMLGRVNVEYIKQMKDRDGISMYEAIKGYGNDPEALHTAKLDASKIKAFFEIHIEQGPVLDATGIELGLVDCIVGIRRFRVTIEGRADHAGTTPMDMRHDANETATKVISKLYDCARSQGDGTVATVGYMKVIPGGVNIVPQEVSFVAEFRSRNISSIDHLEALLKTSLQEESPKARTPYTIEKTQDSKPVYLSELLLDRLEEACKGAGFSYQRMLSGAGHDAQPIASEIDTVMVFVPSKDGRSHCPVESSRFEDLAKAVEIVYQTICNL